MYDPNYAKVIFLDLPCAVHGFVVSDGFDFYTIVLNSRLSYEMQRSLHARSFTYRKRRHIKDAGYQRDLMEDCGADIIEALRHQLCT